MECTCCGKYNTAGTVKVIGVNKLGTWVNCKCGSTMLLNDERMDKMIKAEKRRNHAPQLGTDDKLASIMFRGIN